MTRREDAATGTRTRVLVLLALLGLGVGMGIVGAGVIGAPFGGSDESPGFILVSPDQRTLASAIAQHGNCDDGSLKVTETSRTVTVVWHRVPAGLQLFGDCTGISASVAHLRAPLGSRRLVDGITHASLPSFDGTTMLHPTLLPDGFAHRYDAATLRDDNDVTGGTAGCVQVYTHADSWEEALWITQQPGAVWTPPADVTPQPVTVRGSPGQAIPGEIEWTENGQLITVRSHSYAYALLDTAELVRIADSLR